MSLCTSWKRHRLHIYVLPDTGRPTCSTPTWPQPYTVRYNDSTTTITTTDRLFTYLDQNK